MWSFVAQNFYSNNTSKTRRSVALKKLYWSDFYPTLVKYSTTQYSFKLSLNLNSYYYIYNNLFKKSFWSIFSNIIYTNQGIIYNNITLSYYYTTINKLYFKTLDYRSHNNSKEHRLYLDVYNTLSLPFKKTTFNSLVFVSYYLLTSYYITHPMWFKLLYTYTWLCSFFNFDIALNTFYFKIYKY